MKRIIIFLVLGTAFTRISAQQLTTFSLYDQHGLLHNPATAGAEKHGVIGASFRSMWSGIDGGPQTTIVFGSAYLSKLHLGLGGYVYNDVTGPTKRTGLEMAYAYHINMKNGGSFSLGLEARLQQFSYDKDKLMQALGSTDPVLGSSNTQFKADAGFGVAYNGTKFHAGVSVSQLLQSKLNFYTGNLTRKEEGKLYRHYYLHSSYGWKIDESSVITPNLLFIYLPNAPLEFQGGVRIDYRQLLWWGFALRLHQSWMISAGIKIHKKLNIGYCFDMFTTPLSTFDNGGNAHELMLRYDFLK